MTGELVRYEAARKALAAAHRVDEVKSIRDKAVAMQAYAKQAKDTELIGYATEIRLRAERKAGELLAEMDKAKARGANQHQERSRDATAPPTLADLGVTKTQSSRWQKLAAMPEQKFEEKLSRATEAAVAAASSLSTEEKAERRSEREQELAAKQQALPERKFGVILADPEWRFDPYSRETGMDRAADNHYPTSETDDIAARDVMSIAADDCVLFLWATAPMLLQAFKVMTAWGFSYKSQAIWNKDRIGTGYWFRNKHEILLVGTRGNVPAPAPGTQWPSVVNATVGQHSEKPELFYKLIEEYFPNLPKIELNARAARLGWDAWGYEAPAEAAE